MLVSAIRRLVANAVVQAVVVVVVKTVGDAGLRVGQVGKNGPLVDFKHLRFEARPATFRLRIVLAVASVALRAQGLTVVEQVAVGVAAILPAAVGVHEQARRRRLRPKSTL